MNSKISVVLSIVVLLYLGFSVAVPSKSASQASPAVIVLTVDGAIGPASAEYILDGLELAEQRNAALLVLQLDTPGGLDSATRDIVKAILASSVPIAIYVAPSGARAASAGTYMLYAAHIAAMAPATNLGAATPVQIGGAPGMPEAPKQPGPKNKDESAESAAGSAMERKMTNDAAAYIRGLAELRGRNVEWAEQAVREAASLSAKEALEKNVIDFIADDVYQLIKLANGKTVRLGQAEQEVNLENAVIEYVDPDWRTQFLNIITDPNIAYMLLLLGLYGLIYEFINPGTIFPGVIGGICLLLGFYALQVLPINYAGLALMLLGIALMIAEAFAPSFGILGVGGVIAFSIGSVILLNKEGYSISLPIIIGNAIVSAAFFIWALGMVLRIRRKPPVSGKSQMLGAIAEVKEDFDSKGTVMLMGETWQALSDSPMQKGQRVKVIAIDGLVLRVVVDES